MTALRERITSPLAVGGRTTWVYNYNAISSLPNGHVIAQADRWDHWDYILPDNGDPTLNGFKTTTLSYLPNDADSFLRERPHAVIYPTGRKDSYAYFKGTWSPSTKTFAADGTGPDRLTLAFHGQTTAGTPAGTQISSWSISSLTWTLDPLYMVIGRSTVSETVTDVAGRTVLSAENVYNSSVLERVSGTALRFDAHGRLQDEVDLIRTAGSGEFKTTHSYAASPSTPNAVLTETITAPDGTVTAIEYDQFLRMKRRTVGLGGASAYPAKVENITYNAANLPLTRTYGASSTTYDYDTAGRVTAAKQASPNSGYLTTGYVYTSPTVTTITLPTGATRIEEHYLDGRLKSVTGSAQPPVYWDYDYDGTTLKTIRKNGSTLANGWTEDWTDLLGRPVKHSVAAFGYDSSHTSNVVDVVSTYDTGGASPATGLLKSQTTTYRATGTALQPTRLYSYDAAGRLIREGLDLNEDGSLTTASNDRITDYGNSFSKDASGWRAIATVGTYAVLSSGTLTPVTETRTRFTGFGTNVVGEVVSVDANGRTTTRTDSIDASQKLVTSQIAMDGVTNTAYTTTLNGYAYESGTFAGEITRQAYDSLGRLQYVYGRWNGSAFAATDSYTYLGNTTFVDTQTIGGVSTAYAYLWNDDGRTVTTTTGGYASYVRYNEKDLPMHVGGAGASATEFGYDTLGRRTSLTTYRGGAFDETNWPDITTGDTTGWTLDAATGLVTSKTYANTRHVDYTYTALGQPKTRISPRTSSSSVTTTYDYYDGSLTTTSDVSHRTQELKSITYSDSTPSVVYTYKRSGLPAGVSDVTGSRTFTYDGTYALRLTTETLGSFYNNGSTARVRTSSYDTYGRGTGFQLGTAGSASADLSQTGDYLDASSGLLNHLYTGANGGAARTFTYGYKSNSALVDNYHLGASTTASFALSYDYDATSAARRARVEATWTGLSRTRFDLAYDNRGLLQSAKQSGSAFGDYYSGLTYSSVYDFHAYDGCGQLNTTAKYRGAPPATGTPASADELPGRRFEYRYDGAGNRTTAGSTGTAAGGDDEYVSNSVNQYTSKESNTVRVLGSASASSVVAIQNVTVNKTDRSFAADVMPANASTPAKGDVTITATLAGAGSGGSNLVASVTRSWQIGPQQSTIDYDFDGNLTGDGLWTYDYDAENRLIRMASTAAAVAAGLPNRVLEFRYDSMGRRVQKRSNNITAGTDVYTRYLYDGWNLVGEFAATSTSCGTLQRSYTWGLDITGSTTAAGGVGALVQIADAVAGKTYFPSYDGNGNVSALIDADDGSAAAIYEYSPYGEPLRTEINASLSQPAKDSLATQPFRFSTKFTDPETGLVYYGLRYYSPALGRFINRDPIGEQGGVNLYAFVGNGPTSKWDLLGMTGEEPPPIVLPSFGTTVSMWGKTSQDIVFDYQQGETLRGLNEASQHTSAEQIAQLSASFQGRIPHYVYGKFYVRPGVPETPANIRAHNRKVMTRMALS